MVFSSTTFVFFFLPACLILYLLLPGNKAKNIVLLLFSLVFYAWGEPVYVILMLLSILMNYFVGIFMERIPEWRKFILITGIVLNLAVLGFFKYYGMVIDLVNGITGLSLKAHGLPLPIGISFYTFQALSYVIDLYRRKFNVQKNLFRFALYITMFPQLIAGPIVRYEEVEKQLEQRTVSFENLGKGMGRFIFGLAKKVLLANLLGALFEKSGFQLGTTSVLTAWIGLLGFGFQIFFDFSGYSDMAIGLGKMFGFDFPENFDVPYASGSVTEFWRRWHMTLGTWFREYVYIPLGGNRVKAWRHALNILIVWGLTGLWHGAAVNFLLWGLYYGLLLLFEKYVIFRLKHWPKVIGHILTLLAVFLGWGLFLSNSFGEVASVFGNLFGLSGGALYDREGLNLLLSGGILLLFGAAFSLPIMKKARIWMEEKEPLLLVFVSIALLFLSIAFLVTENYNPFLYFRF